MPSLSLPSLVPGQLDGFVHHRLVRGEHSACENEDSKKKMAIFSKKPL
jgi:hypothetical protein